MRRSFRHRSPHRQLAPAAQPGNLVVMNLAALVVVERWNQWKSRRWRDLSATQLAAMVTRNAMSSTVARRHAVA